MRARAVKFNQSAQQMREATKATCLKMKRYLEQWRIGTLGKVGYVHRQQSSRMLKRMEAALTNFDDVPPLMNKLFSSDEVKATFGRNKGAPGPDLTSADMIDRG